MIASRRSRFRNVHPLGEGSALIESQAMATIRGSVREVMDLFKSSRSIASLLRSSQPLPLFRSPSDSSRGFESVGASSGTSSGSLSAWDSRAPCSASSCGQSP
jgi:hypothetical protein